MADALTNSTTLLTTLGDAIGTRAIYYYDKQRVFNGLVGERYIVPVPQGAKTYEFEQLDTLTFAARGTQATHQDSEAFTTTKRTATPIIHGTNILEAVEPTLQTAMSTMEMYAEAAGAAWAIQEDSVATYSYAALYAEAIAGNVVGANGTALTAASFRQAASKLAVLGARRPYYAVIDPLQTEECFRDSEFKQFCMNDRAVGIQHAATLGVNPDRYLGRVFGVYVFEGNGMISSSGVHAMVFPQGAMGKGYKVIQHDGYSTGELYVERQWNADLLANRIVFAVMQHITGVTWTAGAAGNNWIVDMKS